MLNYPLVDSRWSRNCLKKKLWYILCNNSTDITDMPHFVDFFQFKSSGDNSMCASSVSLMLEETSTLQTEFHSTKEVMIK